MGRANSLAYATQYAWGGHNILIPFIYNNQIESI